MATNNLPIQTTVVDVNANLTPPNQPTPPMDANISDPYSKSIDPGQNLILPTRSQKSITYFNGGTGFLDGALANDSSLLFDGQNITASLRSAYNEYVKIRISGRGGSDPGVFDSTKDLTFHFLINPSQVSITRGTLAEQSFTRGGWQIGLWGEDYISITLSGKTPGQYYDGTVDISDLSGGLTDALQELTLSYRNLLALEILFENNGYWFEGEQVQGNSSTRNSASNWQIKAHQDVELTVGEFIWRGMFETMEIAQDANHPHLMDFSLSFFAWNEKFDTRTPYPDSLGGEVQRGHVPVPGLVRQDKANLIAAQYTAPVPANSGANIQTPTATVNSNIQTPTTAASAASPTVFSPWTTN